MIPIQGTGPVPDPDTSEGGRHSGESYSGPALDLTALSHRRSLVEATETEVAQ